MSPRKRKLDYPARHWEVVAGTWRNVFRILGVTGTIGLLATVVAVSFDGWLWPAAIVDAVFLLTALTCGVSLYDVYRHVCIIPYFSARVGELETFLAGKSLARSFQKLERLATEIGVQPLSAYGFADDLCGETLVWHTAADGLVTTRHLQEAVATRSDEFADAAGILDDLQKLEHALKRASEKNIEFCLMLRHGAVTSGLEWDRRQGTAF